MGYITIYSLKYSSKTLKYELSTQESVLRRTVIENEMRREWLYYRIDNTDQINRIEYRSERWEPYGIDTNCNYIIMVQLNAQKKRTGYIKIVKKSKASIHGVVKPKVKAATNDWIYYGRRTLP